MKKILNCTPHKICIYKEQDCIYDEKTRKSYLKSQDIEPIQVIEPSGKLLNIKIEYTRKGEIDGIPEYDIQVLGADPIPQDADIVIVSALFASQAVQLGLSGVDKLYTIVKPVYKDMENPRPVGCMGITRYVKK